MTATLGIFQGQFALTTAGATAAVTVGGTAVNLSTGSYFTSGYTGEPTSRLCETLQTGIRALGAAYDTSTVVHSLSTNRVTITLETAATLVLNSTMATILGYTATSYSSATSFVATNPPRYTWAPTKAASYYPVLAPPFWAERMGTIYGRTPDGTVFSVVRPTTYDASLEFTDLPKEDVLIPTSGTTYRDLQTWLVDVVAAGKPFRWIFDKTSYAASTAFVTGIWYEEGQEEVGSILDYLNKRVRSYMGLFSVRIPMAKHV